MNMEAKRWQCDVAVVGGGAAGMAAAIRIRNMKEGEGVPMTVALFEPAQLGGLLRSGGKRLVTGPSLSVESARLLADLRQDLESLEIPVLPYRVERIGRTVTGSFEIHVADDTVVEASAVVMATGCRPLSNEFDDFGEGIYITYRGVSFLGKLLDKAREYAAGRPIAVVTNRNVRATLPLFWRNQGDYLFIVPPGQEFELNTLPGSVVACNEWAIKAREDGAFILSLDTPENGVIEPWAGAILLDYVSFQRTPQLPELGFTLEERTPGVPRLDEFLCSSVEGLFFAGDVTARYATVTAALADGIAAGIGAYHHAYRRQFGESPPLFEDSPPRPEERFFETELPVLHEDHVVQWLQTPPTGHPLAPAGNLTLSQAAAATGYSMPQVYSLTYQAMRDRFVTILPPRN